MHEKWGKLMILNEKDNTFNGLSLYFNYKINKFPLIQITDLLQCTP